MNHEPWEHTARLIDTLQRDDLPVLPVRQMSRSKGLHASDLLKVLHPVESTITEAELRIFGILGFAWEDRVERALIWLGGQADWPWLAERPGEVSKDGIACSPDVLLYAKDPDAEVSMLELSIKVTWKSSTDAPDGLKFQYYNDQCMTYATPLDTLSSVLLVYFVNGNYAHQRKGSRGKPPVPQIKAWNMTFSPRERAETWQALRQIAKDIK